MGLGAGSGLLSEAKGAIKKGLRFHYMVLEIMRWILVDLGTSFLYVFFFFTLAFRTTNFKNLKAFKDTTLQMTFKSYTHINIFRG